MSLKVTIPTMEPDTPPTERQPLLDSNSSHPQGTSLSNTGHDTFSRDYHEVSRETRRRWVWSRVLLLAISIVVAAWLVSIMVLTLRDRFHGDFIQLKDLEALEAHARLWEYNYDPKTSCPAVNYTRTEKFSIQHVGHDFLIRETIAETLGRRLPNGTFDGRIRIATCYTCGQEEDVVIHVRLDSSSEAILNGTRFELEHDRRNIDFLRIKAPEKHIDEASACTYMFVLVAMKPQIHLWGKFDVFSEGLNIELQQKLWFESSHFQLRTKSGNITSNESRLPLAHNTRIAASRGSILGKWGMMQSLEIAVNEGVIDVDVAPYMTSYGPYAPADLIARSTSGDINIRMPFDEGKVSLRNYKTNVTSVDGSISGSFIHGAFTNLTTQWGSITADILPFHCLDLNWGADACFVYTTSGHGTTSISVLPSYRSIFNNNPLNRSLSMHYQGRGDMTLRYPEEWAGTIAGQAGGTVDIDGPGIAIAKNAKEGNVTDFLAGKWGGRSHIQCVAGNDLDFYAGPD